MSLIGGAALTLTSVHANFIGSSPPLPSSCVSLLPSSAQHTVNSRIRQNVFSSHLLRYQLAKRSVAVVARGDAVQVNDSAADQYRAAMQKAETGYTDGALEDLSALTTRFPEHQESYIAAAKLHASIDKLHAARQLAAEATAVKPTVESYQLQASLEDRRGCPETARLHFAAADALPEAGAACKLAWARFEQQQGNVTAERQLLEQACEMQPPCPAALQRLGKLLDGCGEHKQARRLFKAAIKVDPTHVWSYQALAVMEARLGHTAAARAAFEEGSRAAPPHAPLLSAWARMEAKRQRTAVARRLWRKALEAEPHHPQSLLGLAALEGRDGNHERASSLYQTAMEAEPNNVRIALSAAQHAHQLRDFALARQRVQALLMHDPDNGHGHHLLGRIHQESGDTLLAYDSFHRGSTSPDRVGALLCSEGLALLEEARGNTSAAREAFTNAAARQKPTARLLREWALFEKRQGRLEEAASLFVRSTHLDPLDGRTWLAAALLARRRQKWKEAEQMFERAAASNPGSPHVYLAWGQMRSQANSNTAGARLVFSRGAELCPNSAALFMEWALLEAADQRLDEARRLFRLGAALQPPHVPLLQAWSAFEEAYGNRSDALDLQRQLASIATADPRDAPQKRRGQRSKKHGHKRRQHSNSSKNRVTM